MQNLVSCNVTSRALLKKSAYITQQLISKSNVTWGTLLKKSAYVTQQLISKFNMFASRKVQVFVSFRRPEKNLPALAGLPTIKCNNRHCQHLCEQKHHCTRVITSKNSWYNKMKNGPLAFYKKSKSYFTTDSRKVGLEVAWTLEIELGKLEFNQQFQRILRLKRQAQLKIILQHSTKHLRQKFNVIKTQTH